MATEDPAADAPTHKPKKPRSPSYPSIPLDTAIDRARQAYEAEGRHAAPITSLVTHWGYAQKSSGGLQTTAALKKFGLLEDHGSGQLRQARLTPLALKILLDEEAGSSARAAAIREAALAPPIHRELWEKYGPVLPSDPTIRTYLLLERNFTDAGVKDFIPEFRKTIEFAGLLDEPNDDTSHAPEPQTPEEPIRREAASPPAAHVPENQDSSDARSIQIPVSNGEWVVLHGSFPIDEIAWEQMMAVLAAMKPALTH